MSDELICPDCGGVIGAMPLDEGRACICLQKEVAIAQAESKRNESSGRDPSNETSVVDKPAPEKICCQCGTDLTGKKRLKDSRGYWCVACHKADAEVNKLKGERCAQCSRIVAESALEDRDGIRICGRCRRENDDAAKQKRKFSPVHTSAHSEEEKRNLYILLGVGGFLVLIILLNLLHLLPHLF
jgi:hypothetical protein